MAARQTKVPAAFLSYAHLDDEAYGSLISRLRERLAFAASVAVGERFEVFQDCDGIAWGQHWSTAAGTSTATWDSRTPTSNGCGRFSPPGSSACWTGAG